MHFFSENQLFFSDQTEQQSKAGKHRTSADMLAEVTSVSAFKKWREYIND